MVIRQGEEGNELFLVASGTQDCRKKQKNQRDEQFLCTFREGMVFGE